MIPLLLTKTADTAHTEIFASVTRPFSVVTKSATVAIVPTPLRWDMLTQCTVINQKMHS